MFTFSTFPCSSFISILSIASCASAGEENVTKANPRCLKGASRCVSGAEGSWTSRISPVGEWKACEDLEMIRRRIGRTKGLESLDDSCFVYLLSQSAHEDGFLGFGSFLHDRFCSQSQILSPRISSDDTESLHRWIWMAIELEKAGLKQERS